MNALDHIDQLRKKVAYTNGLRNLAAKAELAEALLNMNSLQEAFDLAKAAVARARHLLARAVERGAEDRTYRKTLAQCLLALGLCYELERRYEEGEAIYRECTDLYESVEEWPSYAKSMRYLAAAYGGQGRNDEAIRTVDRCLEFCEHINLREPVSPLLTTKAYVLMNTPNKQLARPVLEHAIEAAGESVADKAYAVHAYALYFFFSKEPETADRHFTTAIDLWPDKQLNFSYMTTLRTAAVNRRSMSNFPGALDYLKQAIAIARTMEFSWHEAELRYITAEILQACAEADQAFEQFQTAHKLYTTAGDTTGELASLAQMGRISYETGNTDGGRELLGECAARILETEAEHKHLATIRTILRYCPESCDLDGLLSIVETMIRVDRQQGAHHKIERFTTLGDILSAQEKHNEALVEYGKSLELAQEIGSLQEQANAAFHSAKVYCRIGAFIKAIPLLRTAIELTGESADLNLQISMHELQATACEAAGDTSSALTHLRRTMELERTLRAGQSRRRVEVLKVKHDVATLEEKTAKFQERLDTMAREREADKRIVQVLTARAERDEEVLADLRRDLRSCSRRSDLRPEHILPLLRLTEERLHEVDSSKSDTELVQLDHSFLAYLAEHYPQLTVKERKVCALIRTNISNQEIGRLVNVSTRSIESYRYRIRKKLGLEAGSDLNGAIANLTSEA